MKLRAPFIVFNCLLSVAGLCVLGFALNKWVKYFGAYLVVAGANSNIPFALTFQQVSDSFYHKKKNTKKTYTYTYILDQILIFF